MNDPSYGIKEGATFCKTGDDKRPSLVSAPPGDGADYTIQVCPEDLTQGATEVGTTPDNPGALPSDFWVRVEFDELLDPTIEDIVNNTDGTTSGTIRNTKPVTLTCAGVAIDYDGWYDPSGDAETWPLGPSLRIEPLASEFPAIATGSECTLTLKPNIKDKDGNPVPTDEIGPFTFKVAALELLDQDPEDPTDPTMPDTVDPTAPFQLEFNGYPNYTSVAATDITITEVALNDCYGAVTATRTAAIVTDPDDPTILDISDAGAPTGFDFEPNTTYSITFSSTATVSDSAATPGTADLSMVQTCFTTDAGS